MQIDIPNGAAFQTADDEMLCFHCVKTVNKSVFVKVVLIYSEGYDKCSVCGNYLS